MFNLMKDVYDGDCVHLKYALGHKDARKPTKRDEDAEYDIYAAFDDDCIKIKPHSVKLIPTGLYTAFNDKWEATVHERGSNTKDCLQVMAGRIDSGYRGQWFIALYNANSKPVLISKLVDDYKEDYDYIYHPYSKAIAQWKFERVYPAHMEQVSVDDIQSIASERKDGALGSSGK